MYIWVMEEGSGERMRLRVQEVGFQEVLDIAKSVSEDNMFP